MEKKDDNNASSTSSLSSAVSKMLINHIEVTPDRLVGTSLDGTQVSLLGLPRFLRELESHFKLYDDFDYVLGNNQAERIFDAIVKLPEAVRLAVHYERNVYMNPEQFVFIKTYDKGEKSEGAQAIQNTFCLPISYEVLDAIIQVCEVNTSVSGLLDGNKNILPVSAEAQVSYERGARALEVYAINAQLDHLRASLQLSSLPYRVGDLIAVDAEILENPLAASIKYLLKAVEIEVSFAEAYYLLGIALNEGKIYKEAATFLAQALIMRPKLQEPGCSLRERAQYALAKIFDVQGDTAGAMNVYNPIKNWSVTHPPASSEVTLHLGKILFKSENPELRLLGTEYLLNGFLKYQFVDEPLPPLD